MPCVSSLRLAQPVLRSIPLLPEFSCDAEHNGAAETRLRERALLLERELKYNPYFFLNRLHIVWAFLTYISL